MQSAQISSPRFSYQTAVATPQTLDDFRVTQDNYAGSFSGKSKKPVWIAVVMIAAVSGIAFGVNQYSETHVAKISGSTIGPVQGTPAASAALAPARVPSAAVTPAGTGTPTEPLRPAIKSVAPFVAPALERNTVPDPVTAASNRITARSVVVAPKKATPVTTEPSNEVAPAQSEMVLPPVPAVNDPGPPPSPMIEEKPVVPTPAPNVPPVELPKQ